MLRPGYQTSGFAYQGLGQFAYQEKPIPSGVRNTFAKRRRHLDRESTKEFLKDQLRLKHLPDSAFVDTDTDALREKRNALRAQRRRESVMRAKAAAEAFNSESAALEAAQYEALALEAKRLADIKALKIYNENILVLIRLAARYT